jgi:hypothetical protein
MGNRLLERRKTYLWSALKYYFLTNTVFSNRVSSLWQWHLSPSGPLVAHVFVVQIENVFLTRVTTRIAQIGDSDAIDGAESIAGRLGFVTSAILLAAGNTKGLHDDFTIPTLAVDSEISRCCRSFLRVP